MPTLAELIPVQPFSLPLSRDEFARALRAGLGRAVLHAERYDITSDRDVVLEVCEANISVAAEWLVPFIEKCGAIGEMEASIERHLPELGPDDDPTLPSNQIVPGGEWRHWWSCELAAALAKRGSEVARDALWRGLRVKSETHGVLGDYELVEIHGEQGLVSVAATVGAWLERGIDVSLASLESDRLVLDVERARAVLNEAASARPAILTFLEAVRRDREEWKRRDRQMVCIKELEDVTVHKIIQMFESPGLYVEEELIAEWARNAANEDIRLLVDRMHACARMHPSKAGNYLQYVFGARPLPLDDPRNVALLEPGNELRVPTLRALGSFREPRHRELYDELTRNGDRDAIFLLKANYRPGDFAHWMRRIPFDPAHPCGSLRELRDVAEFQVSSESDDVLMLEYEFGVSSRFAVVETLLDRGRLPDWIREEGQHDCNERTRDLCSGGEKRDA